MTKEELKRKQYDTWNKYYQRHKSEINARRKKVREEYKNKLSVAEKRIEELEKEKEKLEQVLEGYKENATWCDKCKQITKAKEHIRTLISCLIDWVQEGDKDYCYITDAEQFLKEIEK